MKTKTEKIAWALTVLALWVFTLWFAMTEFGEGGFYLAFLIMAASSASTELRKQ